MQIDFVYLQRFYFVDSSQTRGNRTCIYNDIISLHSLMLFGNEIIQTSEKVDVHRLRIALLSWIKLT